METPRDTPRAEGTDGYRIRWDVELGAGGMAQVFLGYAPTPRSDHPVAIKVQREELAADFRVSSRFMREAVISQELTHPNIVATRAMFQHDGRFALVLDLVGPPLRELRDALRGDWDALRCVARDGASALAYLAQEGVVHRDISSGNLLVDPRGRTKLSDFGLASRYDGAYTPPTHGGTWAYLSPERLAGERGTAASDAFSFGALLYELATGIVPFGPNEKSVTAGLPLGAPPMPDEVPDDVRTVIGGFLELDPERRLLPDEVDSLLVPERQPARERIGTGSRIWLHARCPNVEHPSERVRLYGWEATVRRVTDAAPTDDEPAALPVNDEPAALPVNDEPTALPVNDEPAATYAVLLDDEPRQRRWAPALGVTVLAAAAGAASSWAVLELREANEPAQRAAVDIAPPSTPASTPTAGITVRLPDSASAPGLSPNPGDSATATATSTLDAPSWPPGVDQVVERGAHAENPSLPRGRAARGDARAGLKQLANALQNHKQLHNLPGGLLLLSPGVWRGDDVEYGFELLGGQLLDHVLVFGSHTGEAKATIAFSDRGGVITVKTVRGGEHLRIFLADVDGRYAELAGVEVPTRE